MSTEANGLPATPSRKRPLLSPADDAPADNLTMSEISVAQMRLLIRQENATLKTEFLQEVDAKLTVVDSRLDSYDNEIAQMRQSMDTLRGRVADLEWQKELADNRSRRNNLIFAGFPPSQGKEDCIQKVTDLCLNVMGVGAFVNRAHRLRPKHNGQRDIVAHIPNDSNIRAIFKNCAKLKGKNIFIKKDLIGYSASVSTVLNRFRKNMADKKVKLVLAHECFYYEKLRFTVDGPIHAMVLKQGQMDGCQILAQKVGWDVSELWQKSIGYGSSGRNGGEEVDTIEDIP